ncbi:ParA family protein [Actinoplanes sp. NPDC051859]|uniref:ParA family protein n=1 Tax=Actinoplanes sp. NPDC051859 TaxID=3363909 RepID=UPI0037AB8C77
MPTAILANNKGGVGKSALTCALAAALAQRGHRVWAVDMDPQANLSRRLGVETEDPDHPIPTLAEALKSAERGCAADIVVPCGWDDPTAERISLLPARFDLENRVAEAGTVGASLRLSKVMQGLDSPDDWVLIDCPPSLGHLTQMAMVAGGQPSRRGRVLIVVEPEFDALRGAVRVHSFVQSSAADLGVPGLTVAGVVLNRIRSTATHAYNVTEVETRFGPLMWPPYLPLWTAMSDANNDAVPLHTLPGEHARELTTRVSALADRMESQS